MARYIGPGNPDDYASALAVDAGGSVYVTGTSQGSGTSSDYATVRYDSDGNELWVARYNGPGNNRDFAAAITVDVVVNVYVTGQSISSGTSYDYATVKYDTHGIEQWVARYDGTGNYLDFAKAIAVDSDGNVHVTGYSYGSASIYDYATIKYDVAGTELWVVRYNGPGNYNDVANAMVVDADSNVYVTGYSYAHVGNSYDYGTIKYDASGDELWVAYYNGPASDNDIATAMAMDTDGNV